MGFIRLENNIALDIIEAWAIHLDGLGGSYVVGSEGGVRLDPFGYYHNVDDGSTAVPIWNSWTIACITFMKWAMAMTARNTTGSQRCRDASSCFPLRNWHSTRC